MFKPINIVVKLFFILGFCFLLYSCNSVDFSKPHTITVRNSNKFTAYKILSTLNTEPIGFNGNIVLNDTLSIGFYAVNNNVATDTFILKSPYLVSEVLLKNIDSVNGIGLMLKTYSGETLDTVLYNRKRMELLENVGFEGKGMQFLITAIGIIIVLAVGVFAFSYAAKKNIKIPTNKVSSKSNLN